MIDKYYFVKGGAERYMFDLSKIFEKHGHHIIPFSMRHENNFPSSFQSFFVKNIDFDIKKNNEYLFKGFQIVGRILYSLHARHQLIKLIRVVRPDIAHLHMIDHQISPSILHVLKQYKIPVIQTNHQYKLFCPNYRFFNSRTGQICEKCLDKHYWHPIFEKCHKDSIFAGLLIAFEMMLHKAMKIYEKNTDVFHAPSHFMASRLQSGGIVPQKIKQLFYTIDMDQYRPQYRNKNYFVYYGRLSEEKGITTLLRAMKMVHHSNLTIIGDGPLRNDLEAYSKANCIKNVHFLGYKSDKELKMLIGNSKFVVVPSEWYENSPLVIYEAFALGKPVVGASIGGIPELVDHGKTGLLFQAGNAVELARRIHQLLDNPTKILKYGRNARKRAEKYFNMEYHFNEMMMLYNRMIK